MGKIYWTVLCQIFIITDSFSLLCMSDPGVPNTPEICSSDQYGKKSEDGQLRCILCDTLPACPHGLGVSVACGSIVSEKTHIHCVPCVLGKNFSESYSKKPCQKCQSLDCHPNEKVLGKCNVDKDTSKCSGICRRGFYSNAGSLNNCQPCSSCLNNDSTVVKKCKDDVMPNGRLCKRPSSIMPPVITSKLFPAMKTEGKDKSHGYMLYGHPVLFGCLLFIIVILAVSLAILLWDRKRRIKTYCSVDTEEGQTPPTDVGVMGNIDSGVGETNSVENPSEQAEVASLQMQQSSSGSGGHDRTVYYTRQESNSNPGLDFSDEKLDVLSPSAANEQQSESEIDVFDDKKLTLPALERKRTSSSSSGNKYRLSLKRQKSLETSIPMSEHKEKKPVRKRRNTVTGFSNFSMLLDGPKMESKEERMSLLSSTDDHDFSPQIAPVPPEATSSSGERNRIFNWQNSSPISEHMEEKEITSTDHNDNDILPQVATLLSDTFSTPHRLSGVKIGDLNAETHRKLCILLSLEIHNKDWQTLAGRMKYSNSQVKEFANPKRLLEHWGVKDGNDVARLIDLARGLGRDDIVKLLESAESHRTNYL